MTLLALLARLPFGVRQSISTESTRSLPCRAQPYANLPVLPGRKTLDVASSTEQERQQLLVANAIARVK